MLPPRRLFRSRWVALIWAAGVVWTAAEVAGSAPRSRAAPAAVTDATGTPVEANEVAALLGN